MSEECIHGFTGGLCATCNPKPAPEAPPVTRTLTRSRAAVAAAPRASTRGTRAPTRAPASAAPARSVLEQRIYHVTNIRNLPAVLADGALVAGSNPVIELSPPEQRAERADVAVDAVNERSLDRYVPFFLSPDATLWQSLRAGSRHPRLSAAALAADTSEFVFLVSTVRQLVDSAREFAVADGNAQGPTTRFASSREDADRMLHRLRSLDGGDGLLDAELLVHESLPFEAITLIGVQNDKVRSAVRDVLGESGFAPKISVYPPWFQVAD